VAFQLEHDLHAMVGVWHDTLCAYDLRGVAVAEDPFGGVPGPFPYENLVYVDFDGETYRQTNVTIAGRPLHVRTFTATVRDGVLRFAPLGPQAPVHVGVSGGPGLIWFIAENLSSEGLQRYCEPDLIRIEGDSRWRQTILFRDAALVRPMLVTGTRIGHETSSIHARDPRPAGSLVHQGTTATNQYLNNQAQSAES
jgi:hypothetical protein